MYKCPERSFV
jgi:hypothetical protein